MNEVLKIFIPSSGSLSKGALNFFSNCGMEVKKESDRKLVGKIEEMENVEIYFQRSGDIPVIIDRGIGHIGVTGLDRYLEHCENSTTSKIVIDDIGFGDSSLVIAVPNGWIDVDNIYDLIEISYEYKKRSENLKLATKYPNLVRRKLEKFDVNNIVFVSAAGGLEAAPMIGYADIIADITVTGKTMIENNLKPLNDGILFNSQACVIASSNISNNLNNTYLDIINKLKKSDLK
tara:strand:+ start:123 stop:821 length:699 start_codon:yes stop_codon:yes gene_type:complete